MDLMKLGTQLVQDKLGGDASESDISSALQGLLGAESGDGFDLGGMVSNLMSSSGGLQGAISSWLGDGDNEAVSGEQIKALLGSDKVATFASQLGVDEATAADTLAEALPQMVDQGSSGGSILDTIGGLDGALGMVKKFFG